MMHAQSRAPHSYSESLSPLSYGVKLEDVAMPLATTTNATSATTKGKTSADKTNGSLEPKSGKAAKSKSRKRVNTAEKRASHNAVERQRREQLNGRFLDLARLLPSLASARRPSKSAIVNGSISHLSLQREQRLLAAREIRALFNENSEMLAEVNDWRSRSGLPLKEGAGWTRSMEEIIGVESEVFGTFTGMGGVDGDGEGDDGAEEDGEENDGGEDGEEGTDSGMNSSAYMFGNESMATSMTLGQAAMAPVNMYRGSVASLGGPVYGNGRVDVNATPMAMNVPMPVRHMSFTSTADHSSVLSGSPPQLGASYGTQGSPIEAVQQMALQAFLNGDISSGGSPHGSGGVVTPPPHEAQAHVTAFAPASPPTAPTSFSTLTGHGDKVSEWAAQQFLMQYAQDRNGTASAFKKTSDAVNYSVPNTAYLAGSGQARLSGGSFGMMNGSTAQLGATHQALLAHQPALAASAFPPPFAETMPLRSPMEYGGPALWGGAGQGQARSQDPMQQFLAANAAAVASLNPALQGMTYENMDQWMRHGSTAGVGAGGMGQGSARGPMKTPSMEEFREAVRAGINMGLAGLA